MNCSNKAKNIDHCNCTYSGCLRHGVCCECLHYHRVQGQLPACYFTANGEASYDRSIENFIKDVKNGK
jgi:hypothetical protein